MSGGAEVVRQRTPHDCAICTIAMALNRTYEEVMEAALKSGGFFPDKGCKSEFLILEALGVHDDSYQMLRRTIVSREFFREFAWGRRAIMAVPSLNIEGGFHSIYFDGSKIVDPCRLKTYQEWYELKPDEIILFQEPTAVLTQRLKTAVSHIEHMAAWISRQNAGYSFESLGEDMPGIRTALSKTGGAK